MKKDLAESWKKALADCGGVEKFEKDVLPLCSDSVRTCWKMVVKPELNEVKA